MPLNHTHATQILIPGWHGSGPDHWQQHWWRSASGSRLLEQDDWLTPQRRDWVKRLDDAVRTTPGPVVLVAHSLGCITLAHWAQHHDSDKVIGAMLVAPADVERPDAPLSLRAFAPIPLAALPFPALVVGSENDRAASLQRARFLAEHWQADFFNAGRAGHINVASGHHQWEAGRALLHDWISRRVFHPSAATAFAGYPGGRASALR